MTEKHSQTRERQSRAEDLAGCEAEREGSAGAGFGANTEIVLVTEN